MTSYACHADSWTHVSPHWTANLGSKPTLDPRFPARDGKRRPAHSIPPSTTAIQPQDFDFDSACNMLHISERRAACLTYW